MFGTARFATEKAALRPALPLPPLPGLNGTDMGKPTYSELLRDPRWQKVRLKKLESSNWCCERCFDSETTLNVHHKRYVKGRMPWEYDERELAVLCETCHEGEHEEKDARTALLARLAVDGPVSLEDFTAYGAGAISVYDWLLDEVAIRHILDIEEAKSLQFHAGRVGCIISDIIASGSDPRRKLKLLGEKLAAGGEIVSDLLALMKKHGIGDEEANA